MLAVLTGGFDRFTSASELCNYTVCNKLLKQAFAIAKSGLIYDETYRSTLVKN